MALGIPGILVAVVFRLTVPEPLRGMSDAGGARPLTRTPLTRVVAEIWHISSARLILLALGLNSFTGYAALT
jgi:hypothetical protein